MVKAELIKWGVASVSSYMVPEVVLEKLEPMIIMYNSHTHVTTLMSNFH